MRRILTISIFVILTISVGWYIGGRFAEDAKKSIQENPTAVDTKIHRDVAGRIVRLDEERSVVTVDHEEIPGFMGAMIMEFQVAVPRGMKHLKAGDDIRFDLVKINNIYQAVRIRRLSEVDTNETNTSHQEQIENPLGRGDIVPNIRLFSSDGRRFSLHQMQHRTKIITFFYGRCPLSDFCPAQSRLLSKLQDSIRKRGSDLHLLSISLDAKHDRPEILANYAKSYQADSELWTLAGGDNPTAIRNFANRAGARIRTHDGSNEIDHALIALRLDGNRIVDIAYGLEAIEKMVRLMP